MPVSMCYRSFVLFLYGLSMVSVARGFSADQATLPVGTFVHDKTASQGCQSLFPESTWDDDMRLYYRNTKQQPIVAIMTERMRLPWMAEFWCVVMQYFDRDNDNTVPDKIGPFYLICRTFEVMIFLHGPLRRCAYSSIGNCKHKYGLLASSKRLIQSPEDAICLKRLVYSVDVPSHEEQCEDVDYRVHTPQTIIAWSTQPERTLSPKMPEYFKVSNHDDTPEPLNQQHYKPRMNTSISQSAVVINPEESIHPIWRICYKWQSALFSRKEQHTTLHIGYLDFELHWTGVYIVES